MNTTRVVKRKASSEVLGALVLAAVTAGTWYGWLGWDTERTLDPVSQRYTGPYEPWQVVACLATLAVVAIVASFRLSLLTVVAVMTITFTGAWAYDAADDDSPLWILGAGLVGFGMFLGTLLTTIATRLLAKRPL